MPGHFPLTASQVVCPGCWDKLSSLDMPPSGLYGAVGECESLVHDLFGYTLLLDDGDHFLHQLAVDAYRAQHAARPSKPMAVAFALVGLHLTLDCGLLGKQVQEAHAEMARRSRQWPVLAPPVSPGSLTVRQVLEVPIGEARRQRVVEWAAGVWQSWEASHATVAHLAKLYLPGLYQ